MTRLLAVPDPATDTPAGPSWIAQALCRRFPDDIDDLWFPTTENASATAEAREVCERCPVQRACLERALVLTGRDAPRGVWGATTTSERARIRAQRRRAAQPTREEAA